MIPIRQWSVSLKSLLVLSAFFILSDGDPKTLDENLFKKILKTDDFTLPYQVAIYYKGEFKCAGAKITPNHALTLATCLDSYSKLKDSELRNIYSKIKESELKDINAKLEEESELRDMKVTASNSLKPKGDDENTGFVAVQKIFIYHTYSHAEGSLPMNNIAIIQTVDEIPYSPIYNMSLDFQYEADPCIVIGWGSSMETQSEATGRTLEAGIIEIWEYRECYDKFYEPHHSTLCAGLLNDDPCIGDYGSPLFCRGAVAGLLSVKSCGKGMPAIYTDVFEFEVWIMDLFEPFEVKRPPKKKIDDKKKAAKGITSTIATISSSSTFVSLPVFLLLTILLANLFRLFKKINFL